MEVVTLPKSGRYVIFPDHPESWIEVRRLTDGETAKIYDEHKVQIGSKKNTMARFTAATRAVIKAGVVAWGDWTREGAPLVVENSAHKDVVLDAAALDEDGEVTTVGQLLARRMDEESRELLKNSGAPSLTLSESTYGSGDTD